MKPHAHLIMTQTSVWGGIKKFIEKGCEAQRIKSAAPARGTNAQKREDMSHNEKKKATKKNATEA